MLMAHLGTRAASPQTWSIHGRSTSETPVAGARVPQTGALGRRAVLPSLIDSPAASRPTPRQGKPIEIVVTEYGMRPRIQGTPRLCQPGPGPGRAPISSWRLSRKMGRAWGSPWPRPGIGTAAIPRRPFATTGTPGTGCSGRITMPWNSSKTAWSRNLLASVIPTFAVEQVGNVSPTPPCRRWGPWRPFPAMGNVYPVGTQPLPD